eukprot:UN02678
MKRGYNTNNKPIIQSDQNYTNYHRTRRQNLSPKDESDEKQGEKAGSVNSNNNQYNNTAI